MKNFVLIIIISLSVNVYGQNKKVSESYSDLISVEGTNFVIASIEKRSKSFSIKSSRLLFINTKTGDTNQINFPENTIIRKIEQIKIDSLGINLILVQAKSVDLDGKNGINWNDPTQLYILSYDGTKQIKATQDNYFLRGWVLNKNTGRLVITGKKDSNNNKKSDKEDKNEIHIFDLLLMKLVFKI